MPAARLPSFLSRAIRTAALTTLTTLMLGLDGCAPDADKPATPASSAAGPATTAGRTSLAALTRSRQRIDSLEAKITEAVQSSAKAPDIRLTMYMIQAYQYFAADFPKDPRAPEALDRAGQLWSGVLNDHQKAVEHYEKVYQEYPAYKNRPQLLVQMGVAAEAAQDTASAAIAYHRVLNTYPQHPLAEQARGLLKLLRMSEAERKKSFGGQK